MRPAKEKKIAKIYKYKFTSDTKTRKRYTNHQIHLSSFFTYT